MHQLHDAGMLELAVDLHLALEEVHAHGAGGHLGQDHLDGDHLLGAPVDRLVDARHASATQLGGDVEAGQVGVGGAGELLEHAQQQPSNLLEGMNSHLLDAGVAEVIALVALLGGGEVGGHVRAAERAAWRSSARGGTRCGGGVDLDAQAGCAHGDLVAALKPRAARALGRHAHAGGRWIRAPVAHLVDVSAVAAAQIGEPAVGRVHLQHEVLARDRTVAGQAHVGLGGAAAEERIGAVELEPPSGQRAGGDLDLDADAGHRR